jgi:hypothetical protein
MIIIVPDSRAAVHATAATASRSAADKVGRGPGHRRVVDTVGRGAALKRARPRRASPAASASLRGACAPAIPAACNADSTTRRTAKDVLAKNGFVPRCKVAPRKALVLRAVDEEVGHAHDAGRKRLAHVFPGSTWASASEAAQASTARASLPIHECATATASHDKVDPVPRNVVERLKCRAPASATRDAAISLVRSRVKAARRVGHLNCEWVRIAASSNDDAENVARGHSKHTAHICASAPIAPVVIRRTALRY